jgi:hypothetical protein
MRVRRIRNLVAAAVLAGTGLLVVHGTAEAATACSVVYTANSWSSGFTADVKVTNGGAAVSSWTLGWTFAGNQQVTNAWNATVKQTGTSVTATSVNWNGSLATGASASFGFQGTYSGTNATPSNYTFNGVSCGADVPPTTSPTVRPSSVSPSPSVSVSSSSPSASPSVSPSVSSSSASPSPSVSQSSQPNTGCVPSQYCDGFENQTGSAPSGNWTVNYPDCSGAGTAAIDRTTAHSGSTSLKINGAAGYCNHVFVKNTLVTSLSSNVWYFRYYVKHTTALPASHTTNVAMQDANDGNKDLRFGGQNSAMQFNRQSDDATLPEQSPAGVAQSAPLPTNTWNCVELKVSGADGTLQTWLNGTAIPGLTEDGVPTHDIDSQWLNRTWRPKLTDFRVGWESYGEGADTLWFDDVAGGSSRIGC